MPFLLLAVILLLTGYLLPVTFRLQFGYNEEGVKLSLSMTVLHGLLRKEHNFLGPVGPLGTNVGEKVSAGPLRTKQEKENEVVQVRGLWGKAQEARERLVHYGLGTMLLSYFIPTKYLAWLRVAGDLERKGRFTRLSWRTMIGLEEAAATAWVVGLFWAVKGVLLAKVDQYYQLPRAVTRVSVEPSFNRQRLATTLDCIFKLRVGQIIVASVHGFLLDKLRRRKDQDAERTPDRGPLENGDAEH